MRANARRDKVAVLLELREQLEELKVLLRLGQDVKAFANFNSFAHATQQVVELDRQNEGWLKSQRSGPGPESAGDAVRASHAERAMITGSCSRLLREANAEVL